MNNRLITYFKEQLKDEAITTRAMLKLVPADKYNWQPHPKSMTLFQLSKHVAEIPGWIRAAIELDVLDFAKEPPPPPPFATNRQLMDFFEEQLALGNDALNGLADDAVLDKKWTMRNGEQLYFESSKGGVLRMTFSQLIHHRAQLGVFLRLLNIPIPGSYGPSADEMGG